MREGGYDRALFCRTSSVEKAANKAYQVQVLSRIRYKKGVILRVKNKGVRNFGAYFGTEGGEIRYFPDGIKFP